MQKSDTGISGIEVHVDTSTEKFIKSEDRLSLRALHGKNKISFEPELESEGTKNLINLWVTTMFFEKRNRTCIFDEIESSLHPELMRFFLEYWIENASSQSQIIFTTHNDNLLEDDLLRRDEVWFVTKNKEGASELASLVEYKISPKTNIQQSYIMGAFNGIPRLGPRKFYYTNREK